MPVQVSRPGNQAGLGEWVGGRHLPWWIEIEKVQASQNFMLPVNRALVQNVYHQNIYEQSILNTRKHAGPFYGQIFSHHVF